MNKKNAPANIAENTNILFKHLSCDCGKTSEEKEHCSEPSTTK